MMGFPRPNRMKKCKSCKEKFTPYNSTQTACNLICALDIVEAAKAKKARKELREGRERLKSVTDYKKEAQTAFNSYIRARDKGKPCISCDKPDNGQHQRHASHYRSVGACSSLRYNTFNVHTSCATCNSVLSGNLIEYRIRLVKKLGIERVEWLECQNEVTRYDVDYLKRLKKIFNKKTKGLKCDI